MAERCPDPKNFSPTNLAEFFDLYDLRGLRKLLLGKKVTLEQVKQLTKEDILKLGLDQLEEERLIRGISLLSIKKDETLIKNRYQSLTSEAFANERRIVLIGKTGTGKSSTGNSILGIKHFYSSISCSSVTKECRRGSSYRFGWDLQVIDTPGLFDTDISNEKNQKEIVKCIGMTSPGPHAFVLVLTPNRFTKEEEEAVKHFVDHFGEEFYHYLILLFTRKDDLDTDGIPFNEFISSMPNNLKRILEKSGHRCIAFNNRENLQSKGNDAQVKELLDLVETVINENDGQIYSNEDFKKAEQMLQEREMLLRKEKEREIALQIAKMREEIEKIFHDDLEKVKRQLSESDVEMKKMLERQKLERNKENEKFAALLEKQQQLEMHNKEKDRELANLKEKLTLSARAEENCRKIEKEISVKMQNLQFEKEALKKQVDKTKEQHMQDMKMLQDEMKNQKENYEELLEKRNGEIARSKKEIEIGLLRANRELERREVEQERGFFQTLWSGIKWILRKIFM